MKRVSHLKSPKQAFCLVTSLQTIGPNKGIQPLASALVPTSFWYSSASDIRLVGAAGPS